jgi:hypothetical protein
MGAAGRLGELRAQPRGDAIQDTVFGYKSGLGLRGPYPLEYCGHAASRHTILRVVNGVSSSVLHFTEFCSFLFTFSLLAGSISENAGGGVLSTILRCAAEYDPPVCCLRALVVPPQFHADAHGVHSFRAADLPTRGANAVGGSDGTGSNDLDHDESISRVQLLEPVPDPVSGRGFTLLQADEVAARGFA